MKHVVKNIVFVFIFVFIILLVGCNSTVSRNQELISAEQLMEERPDSSLIILQGIDTMSLKSSADKALYSVLYVQALDKNYIDTQDISQIQRAVDFYKDLDDEYHKMLSYYYLARIQENTKEYSKAIINLLKAEVSAKKINNYFYLGLICRSFSDIYNNAYNSVESLNYAQKAYEYFQLSGYTNYADWGLWDIGKAFHNSTDYNSSIEIGQKVVNIASVKQDTLLLSDGLRLLATSYVAKKDYTLAQVYYNGIRELDNNLLTIDDYRNIGVSYFGTGDIDSAKFYMDMLMSIDTTQKWLSYQWNKHIGNYKEALNALESENANNNKILHDVINQNVTEAVSIYRNHEILAREKDLIHTKRTKNTYIIVFATIAILITIIVTQRSRSQKKEIENNMLLASNLRNMLQIKESEAQEMQDVINSTMEHHKAENEAMQNAISNLFEQRFATIDRLSSTYYEYQGTVNEKHKIYTNVMELVSGLGSDQKTLKELESFVNTYRDNLMSRFRETFPEIKESDCILYLYSVAGFSARAISIFINEKLEVVYNRKSRLKQKISRSSSIEKEKFMSYM